MRPDDPCLPAGAGSGVDAGMTEFCGPAEATAEDAQRATDAMYASIGADFGRRYRAWTEMEQTQAAWKRAAARQPELPQVHSAWQAYAGIRAAEARQLEAMGGTAEIGTDAGERYRALGWDAYHAYGRYLDAYSAARPPNPIRRLMPGPPSMRSSAASTPTTAMP